MRGDAATSSSATVCSSFREREEGIFMNSCECEKGPNEKTDIDCEAKKCRYNANKKCDASQIEVIGADARKYTETSCETFRV